MADTATKIPLASVTLSATTDTVVFGSISQSYTDLILVSSVIGTTTGQDIRIQINGDTATNYSATWFDSHYNSSPTSGRLTNRSNFQLTNYVGTGTTEPTASIVNFFSYSNTTTYKTMVARHSQIQGTYYETMILVNLWRSTSAINSISIYLGGSTFASGSKLNLYGVL